MNILLPVIGTRGDNQLFLALARALDDAGHQTTVALADRYVSLASSHGLRTAPLGGRHDEGMPEVREMMRAGTTLKAARIGTASFHRGVRRHTAALQELCPAYDLIVCYGDFGRAEADKANKPHIKVVVEPTMAEKRLSGHVRHDISLLVERASLYFLINREHARFRKEIGAPPTKHSPAPLLVLLPMSEHVVRRGTNWTARNAMAGFWYLNAPADYSPTEGLQGFIQRGERPLFIGFGSAGWSEEDDERLLRLLIDAVSAARQRAIIATPNAVRRADVSDSIYLVDDVPHDWMFSQVSCVIHHCGLGTTAAVLRAGIPSIPVPYLIDQFAWARRINSIGVAVPPVPRKQLTSEKLAQAIARTCADSELRANATELAQRLRQEDGLRRTVEAIERAMRGNSRLPVS